MSGGLVQCIVRVMLAALWGTTTACLWGCRQQAPDQAIGDSFGFIAGCEDGNWEKCRRANHARNRDSVSIYEELLNRSLDEALEFSPSKSTVPRSRFEVVVGREATSAFVFESKRLLRNGVELRRVETTGETMATIGKMAIALRLHEVPRFTDAWIPRYLLYIRKTPEGDPIIDPLRASGLVYYDPELRVTADFIAPLRAALEDTYSAMSFLVAHELYHLDHPFQCKDDSETCMGRRRQHEADADAFAIYVLSNHAKNEGVPDHYLAVPLVIFSQLMLTMEGRRKPIFPRHILQITSDYGLRQWQSTNGLMTILASPTAPSASWWTRPSRYCMISRPKHPLHTSLAWIKRRAKLPWTR